MQTFLNNEKGFVMVVALMILVILSLIGIAGLDTSMFEEQIAGNDWSAKRTFYKSDGGTELGSELLEYNFSCGPITSTKITTKINNKIDELTTSLARYATRAELEAAIIERNDDIAALKEADVLLAKKHVFQVWLTGAFSMAFGVGLTILFNMALK